MHKTKKLAVSRRKVNHSKWKKGQSCLSNPSYSKHRSAAKSGLSVPSSKTSNFTYEALHRHNDDVLDDFSDKISLKDDNDSDDASHNALSVASSTASKCTNVTFSKIINRYNMSSVPEHKELILILEGAAEVIRGKGDEDTDVQYVAMLTTLLKSKKVDECKQVEAILFLLSLCVKRVPQSLLRLKYEELSKVVMDAVSNHVDQATQSFVKSAISILSTLLRSLSASSWNEAGTKQTFYTILCMTHSNKPKVRKAAQQAVASLLRGSCFMLTSKPPATHPAAHDTATFCVDKLQAYIKGGDTNTTLYIATMLGDVMSLFSKVDLKDSCEALLKLMTLSDAVMKVVCLNSLRKMFSIRPSHDSMPAQLNAQIILAVFEYQPNEEDFSTTTPWLQLLLTAFSNLSKLSPLLYLQHLPRLFEASLRCMKAHPKVTTTALNTLLGSINNATTEVLQCIRGAVDDSAVHKVCRKVQAALTYQYMSVWQHVLAVVVRLLEFFGKACPDAFKGLLVTLDSLREAPNFSHEALVDKVFGTSVRILGAPLVLETVPLNITGTESDDLTFPRSWLLPVLRDNARDTQLSYFVDRIIPLINNISTRCQQLQEKPEKAALKAYQVLRCQLWSLLPAFCTAPCDLVQSFPRVAQLLGKVASCNEEVRLHVLCAIRNLASHHVNKDEDKAVLARFSKNFLPLFCNLYTSTTTTTTSATSDSTTTTTAPNKTASEHCLLPTSHNLALLDTFKAYLSVSERTVIDNCVNVCFGKVKGDLTACQRRLVMDLLIVLTPHMSPSHLQELSQYALQMIHTEDKMVQKKNYRLLEEVCKVALCDVIQPLVQPLSHHVSQSSNVAKAPRLRCLRNIVKRLQLRDDEFYKSIIPEAVLCTKAVGSKARLAAFGLIQQLAKSYVHHSEELFPKKALVSFLAMLLPGLTASENMAACTLLSLSKVVHELKDDVTTEVVGGLVENAVLLLRGDQKVLVTACLLLLKTLTSACKQHVQQHLAAIMTGLSGMSNDMLHHMRFKIKELYLKLSKLFGVRVLVPMAPACHHKMLHNMRKEQDKAAMKKKTKMKGGGGDEDDDDDDDKGDMKSRRSTVKTANTGIDDILRGIDSDDSGDDDDEDELEYGADDDDAKSRKSAKSAKSGRSGKSLSKKKRGKEGGKRGAGGDERVWLKEDENIIDFLDPSVTQNVLSSRPAGKKKVSNEAFKTMPDGRLIIPDDRAEEKRKKQKTEVEEAIDMVEVAKLKNRKRKMSRNNMSDEEEEDVADMKSVRTSTDKSQFSYRAGGSGIHRPIKKKQKKPSNEETGNKFKAKKAKGDVKKGSVDPYAYYPLDSKMANKRNKRKMAKIVKRK